MEPVVLLIYSTFCVGRLLSEWFEIEPRIALSIRKSAIWLQFSPGYRGHMFTNQRLALPFQTFACSRAKAAKQAVFGY
jgi:hypothetical protein